jgi:hypothetical protein
MEGRTTSLKNNGGLVSSMKDGSLLFDIVHVALTLQFHSLFFSL